MSDTEHQREGWTTPERAAETARALRETYAAMLRRTAERLMASANAMESGDLPKHIDKRFYAGCTSWTSNSENPLVFDDLKDVLAVNQKQVAYAIMAYERLSLEDTPQKVTGMDLVAAKAVLGRWEKTITDSMRVTWMTGVEGGEGEKVCREGWVLSVHDGMAAVGSITEWRGASGNSVRGIQAIPIGDLSPKP